MGEHETRSILFSGVGGQGQLLAGKVTGLVLTEAGYDVKVSEVHGMSQRGGSVEVYVRYGEQVFSPVIEKGGADIIVALEKLEAARYLPYLKKGGIMAVNVQQIDPMPVVAGEKEYPVDVLDEIGQKIGRLIKIDALSIAQQAGSVRAVNSVMLGVLSGLLPFSEQLWLDALAKSLPAKVMDMNKTAFLRGRSN